jgi:hypothetical protein
VTGEIKRNQYDVFIPLLKLARENKCKVHGLGFTNLKGLEKYRFDSVDSTSWLYGNRKGSIFLFNGKGITDVPKPPGTRLKSQEVAKNNFDEWVKFQKYADKYL